MGNNAEAWVNLGNVLFIYQNPGNPTTIRFAGSTDNQITIKENLNELASRLPNSEPASAPRPPGSGLSRLNPG